jgi:tRNA(fMet)-specific endonuclease VapC
VARVILVDTDILIDALHGLEPARTRVARGIADADLATTAITAFELEVGASREPEAQRVEAILRTIPVLPIDLDTARIAGGVARALAARGARIGAADALIAGACLASGAALWTRNRRHFAKIPGLRLTAEE